MQQKISEETRKLQFTGGSTYIISLPKSWIKENQLTRGSTIKLRKEESGSLTITPYGIVQPSKKNKDAIIKVFSTNESSNTIIRKTVSAYLVGYNMLHIRAKGQKQLSAKQRSDLKNFSRQMLVGTEIVTDTAQELTLQVLLSYPELSVQSALRRMSIITSSMQKDAITALKFWDKQQAREILVTDNEVDRFNLYIIRQLKTAIQNPRIIKEVGPHDARDCLGHRLITKAVERTADHAANIARNMLLLTKTLHETFLKKIVEMSELAITSFERAIESLFKGDFDMADDVIKKTENISSLEKTAILLLKESEMGDVANIRLLIESIRRTVEYAKDIAEIVLNLTVESVK